MSTDRSTQRMDEVVSQILRSRVDAARQEMKLIGKAHRVQDLFDDIKAQAEKAADAAVSEVMISAFRAGAESSALANSLRVAAASCNRQNEAERDRTAIEMLRVILGLCGDQSRFLQLAVQVFFDASPGAPAPALPPEGASARHDAPDLKRQSGQ